MQWVEQYALMNQETAAKSISFIRNYRSYVINYNFGLDLVKAWVEKNGGTDPETRWKVFEKLLSGQIRIKDLEE